MNIPLIDLKAQYESLAEDLDKAALGVLSSANYIMGKTVTDFEKEFADFIGVKHAISVGNGTDALVLALKSMGIGEGDEVITTPFTFFATAETISAVGATPVFVDVDKETFNIDVTKIEEKITSKTKAIMPVHIFGQSADMDEINEIAKKHNLYVIEDACQAIGGKYRGRKIGTLGDVACFSFFPTKNLGCAGDGGMIVTDNDEIAIIARALRTHGSGENGQKAYNLLNNIEEEIKTAEGANDTVYNPLKYYNYLIGYNTRLDAIQAAILSVKLKEIDSWNAKRREIVELYNEALQNSDLVTPVARGYNDHVYHMYILQSENREEVLTKLKEAGIATGVYYPVPLHLQKVYKNLGYKEGDMPVSEYLSHRTFAIPVYPELTKEQIDYIISKIK
ncbi:MULTISPECIES: DegT/DnrJ/EryC1/StrS aminotransferase family protein [Clostridium]|uniref:DegT/DnrJ/EryC1/StrS family aminotransferase n=1 Tax=Clostridium TaxID=1485 RepID=UPI0018AC7EFF|nr:MULTISPECIES: DegT/DnrJ/EryC1/StrS family aminotransferase [Clostridium]MDB1934454.1 DegT/DnrJ/EryC1/StrS family aminotransferase [Clostridium tertium]MDB1937682.1 DegT/DnrJ/EryC1/StrS family aminotransferase [Clostridium tertium]MDB1969763.1 DegT/DnrJ/EryC1/StrS family aminotransferase [Clostridium tertium]MDU7363232.1 DegT/DnrJ/EryC1/StrS family aminotransferase [Clostridium sp.]